MESESRNCNSWAMLSPPPHHHITLMFLQWRFPLLMADDHNNYLLYNYCDHQPSADQLRKFTLFLYNYSDHQPSADQQREPPFKENSQHKNKEIPFLQKLYVL